VRQPTDGWLQTETYTIAAGNESRKRNHIANRNTMRHCEEVVNGHVFRWCAVWLPPVLSVQLHRYPKCIAKWWTPVIGVNVTYGLISSSTVVFFFIGDA